MRSSSKRNPRLIYAVGTGFGLTGPYSPQGRAGCARAGDVGRDGAARRSEPAAFGLFDDLRGLFGRHASRPRRSARALANGRRPGAANGSACRCLDSMLAAQTQEAAAQLMRGREVNWGAMPLTGVFETSDGALVMVGAFKADPIGDIGKALGLPYALGRCALQDACAAGREQGGAARIFRERFRVEHDGKLARAARGAGSSLRAGATLAEALADEQTGDQRHGHRMRGPRRTRARRRLADPSARTRRLPFASAGRARRAHGRGARRDRKPAHPGLATG